MKKRISAVLLVLMLLAGFAACGGVDTEIDKNISEIRLNLYEGNSDAFEVTIFIGKRENPYSLDGVSSALVDYCLINVMPSGDIPGEVTLSYQLSGGKYNQTGNLTKDIATGRYRADALAYHADTPEINITISGGDIVDSVIVKAKHSTDMMTWKDALSLARESLSESFAEAFSGDQLKGEIFIRFVNNPLIGEDKYFWYVLLKDQRGKLSSVLIDSLSREIVAKNVL